MSLGHRTNLINDYITHFWETVVSTAKNENLIIFDYVSVNSVISYRTFIAPLDLFNLYIASPLLYQASKPMGGSEIILVAAPISEKAAMLSV